MKNIAIIILVFLLGFVTYLYSQDNSDESQVTTNNSNGAVIIDSDNNDPNQSAEPDTDDAGDDELTVSTTTSVYCQELKDAVSGSEPYVIMTGLAGGSTITNGQTLGGCVYAPNGSYAGWAPFEGQIGSYSVVADDGTILGQGLLPVVPVDWMTPTVAGEDIEYTTNLDFDSTGYTSGSVTLKNENASGEPVNEKTVTIPVVF